ncbi:MAG: alpha-2-macroglobulin [Acetobacteraceae bacterium]|nr:alpha-2-macroglobulin [Acetobacteraceae bacterium]
MRWFLLFLLFATGVAHADEFEPPGLAADSEAYQRTLTRSNPAGLSAPLQRQAEQRAAAASARNDWAAAATALETRLSAGNGTSDLWLDLARAQLQRTPPNAARAAQAAWLAFGLADAGKPQIPPLLVLVSALIALDRPGQALGALEAIVERAPDEPRYRQRLDELRQTVGLLVRSIRTEPESDPPLACISFTSPPSRRADLVPADWVRLDPAVPDAAVTRQGDAYCIAGLPLGATTRVTLRAGLPGESGLTLKQEATLSVAMANREPRLVFDQRLFLLPRNQAPRLSLTSVNLSAVKLKLLRLTERNLVPWLRDNALGQPIERSTFDTEVDHGTTVWEGSAAIPNWQPNLLAHTVLPLPDVFDRAGAYLLLATPGDGTPDTGASAVQALVRTDLAPTIWRGSDGLTVQVRSFADAQPRPGVALTLLAHDNDILADAVTDADGVARFPAPLLRGTGPQAPQSLHGQLGDDLVTLDLTTAAFDLSDRGVEGLPDPGPLDAFAWTDRGIYRPGETVHLSALLRDAAGHPVELPAHLVIKRPNGQVFLDRVPERGPDGSLTLPVILPLSAPAGMWSADILADPKRPPIGHADLKVDAFVPDRMAVEAMPAGPIIPDQRYSLPVTARFLYGAPAIDLSGSATLRLARDPAPPPALAGYRVGLDEEEFAPQALQIPLPTTDKQGRSTLSVLLKTAPDSTAPVRADIDVAVDDPSGRASHTQVSIPVRPVAGFIGIKPTFDGAIDAGAEAGFEIAAVDRDGQRVAMPARLRLVRERPDWRLVMRGSLARYETVYRDEPVTGQDVAIPPDGALHFAQRLDFGRYRLEIAQKGGLAASSIHFRAGWTASSQPDTPDKVDVATDKRTYAPGEIIKLHIAAPFAGRATLLALTNRVESLRTLDVTEVGTTVELPADAAWGPGAYLALHVFRGGDAAKPARAIGLAWAQIDPGLRTLPLAIADPGVLRPRTAVTVAIKTEPGAWLSLAAVDEGILRLTGFPTPDPAAHFLGRRRLGIDIRDDWGRLIPVPDGLLTTLRQGGDDGGSALPEIPQKTVALFVPPVQAGPDGTVAIPLDLPDFNGQVRLMAVAWHGDKIGAAARPVTVRDPVIAEPLLPRFLAPGDEARLGILLQNVEQPAGEASVVLSVDGPLAIAGDARMAAQLDPGAQVVRTTTLRATGVGRGVIHMAVTAPGGLQIQRDTAILIRSARPPLTLVSGGELAPGAETRASPALDRMLPGTALASLSAGGAVRYDVGALVQALVDYPLLCLEQASSKGLPLALLTPTPDRAARLQADAASVLDKQRFDGGFGLWSAQSEAETWLSAYAAEFLLRARRAGAPVPDTAIADALRFLSDGLENLPSSPAGISARAYYLYALALGGQPRAGANRVLAERLDTLPTPLAKAQLGAALALSNDRPRAEAAFAAALASPARRDWDADRGSALRDQLATATLLRESGLLPEKLGALIGRLPGADLKPDALNTQEEAWGAAAGIVLGRDTRPTQIALDGRALAPSPMVTVPLTGPISLRNGGERPIWQTVSTTGVPIEPAPASRDGMRVSRRFLTLSGDPVDLDNLRQNTVFVLLVEGAATDGQDHRALLLQGLPAGWEIAGRLEAGKTAGLPWLSELTATEAEPASDDRFAATLMLSATAPSFRVAVRIRAVTPGSFELPGAQLSDMYRPAIFARQATNTIKVLAAE